MYAKVKRKYHTKLVDTIMQIFILKKYINMLCNTHDYTKHERVIKVVLEI